MSVEFTHVPVGGHHQRSTAPMSFFDSPDAMRKLTLLERTGFGRVVIDSAAGILSNMDLAAEAARRTSSLGLVMTHWAGVIEPAAAACQLADLDRMSEGRLSLRFSAGFDGAANEEPDPPGRHVEFLQRTDEYLILLKRLWSNEMPFDHEGRFYSVRNGHVAKPAQGSRIEIRMGGDSGTALKVAGRHADIFELTPGTPQDIGHLIARVRAAAEQYGRANRIRFALPVSIGSVERGEAAEPDVVISSITGRSIRVSGSPAQVSQALLSYVSLGVGEFMVGGLDGYVPIANFAQRIAPTLRQGDAAGNGQLGIPGAAAGPPFNAHAGGRIH